MKSQKYPLLVLLIVVILVSVWLGYGIARSIIFFITEPVTNNDAVVLILGFMFFPLWPILSSLLTWMGIKLIWEIRPFQRLLLQDTQITKRILILIATTASCVLSIIFALVMLIDSF